MVLLYVAPMVVPRDETDIAWFCAEQGRTFADAPPYEGEGPYGLAYEVMPGMETEDRGLESYLRVCGASVGRAGTRPVPKPPIRTWNR